MTLTKNSIKMKGQSFIDKKARMHNKNDMSIGVLVRTTKLTAHNNSEMARQTNDQGEFSRAKATRNRQLHIFRTLWARLKKTLLHK